MRHGMLVAGVMVVLLALPAAVRADDVPTAAEQLAAAGKAGRPSFLIVTEPRVRELEAMRSAVREAVVRAPQVAVVEMDRTLEVNKPLVKRYGLAGVPVPMVLIVAHNGAPGGGVVPGPKAVDKLLALLPSPRKADTLLAIFQRKAAFVVVGRPDMPRRPVVLDACRKAAAALDGKAAIIEVDLKDKKEQGFLKVLGADLAATDVAVHVYGLASRKTGVLVGAGVTADALVQAAKKKQECCPGGKCH